MSSPRENILRHLSPEEQQQPELVLQNLFESFHLHELQTMLELAQKMVLHSLRNKGQREQETWLYFFEKLERLVEAGWVMRG